MKKEKVKMQKTRKTLLRKTVTGLQKNHELIGCDLVEIQRIVKLSQKAKQKIFHPSELKNKRAESLAGIFAVKESCKKIFNELQWLDIEVVKEKNGKPKIVLPFPFAGDVSVSHDGEYAMAVVVKSG